MFDGLKDWLAKREAASRQRRTEQWYAAQRRDLIRYKGTRAETTPHEVMGRSYTDDGNYAAAAKEFQAAADISAKYPDMQDQASKYRKMAAASKEKAKTRGGDSGLEDDSSTSVNPTLATISIGFVVLGLLFLSTNLTGNVIGTNQTPESITGAIIFLIGLVGAFFVFRNKF